MRITPAYAGTTCQIINPSIYTRDHPCICGDYLNPTLGTRCCKGSPLHMRGLRSVTFISCFSIRITPAYAGTTLGLYLQMRLTGDHPCICGDYNNSLFSSKYNLGSPLHMRGLPQSHLGHPLLQGITPAYAGTTY